MAQGQDVLAVAHARMNAMEKDELIKLVLIAANRVGVATNGDSPDPNEALDSFLQGIETVFSAYDTALFTTMHSKVTWGGFENVARC